MHKASGSLNNTPGNARVRQGEIPLVWEKPQLGHPPVTKGFFMPVSATYGCHREHAFIPNTRHKKRGFDSVFSCPISFPAENKVPANKQSLSPVAGFATVRFLHLEWCREVQWNVGSPTDPVVCPTELWKLLWYLSTSSGKVPSHCLGRGIAPQSPDPCQSCRDVALNNKKQSGQLRLLFLSGHPTPPGLVVDSSVPVFLLTGKRQGWLEGQGSVPVLVCLSEVFLLKWSFKSPRRASDVLWWDPGCWKGEI